MCGIILIPQCIITDAELEIVRQPILLLFFRQGSADYPRDLLRAFIISLRLKYDHKFVSAVSAEEYRTLYLFTGLSQGIRSNDQRTVSFRVTKRIIDPLEPVDVQHHDIDLRIFTVF